MFSGQIVYELLPHLKTKPHTVTMFRNSYETVATCYVFIISATKKCYMGLLRPTQTGTARQGILIFTNGHSTVLVQKYDINCYALKWCRGIERDFIATRATGSRGGMPWHTAVGNGMPRTPALVVIYCGVRNWRLKVYQAAGVAEACFVVPRHAVACRGKVLECRGI